jgi:peptidoglycan/xylan/chitin deacetylase (PgdA/CDA1 family)
MMKNSKQSHTKESKTGTLVISLDFELYWGVRDKRSLEGYGTQIKRVHQIVPKMLELFREYGVKATFATVGLLFANHKEEVLEYLPERKPGYADNNLSPYPYLDQLRDTDSSPAYHYALDLIQLIRDQYPEHEIGTHTFSHYYCQEPGQTAIDFAADLNSAVTIAKRHNITIESIVFPRNQYNPEYLRICAEHGIRSYRGNEKAWYFRAESESDTTLLKRILRTLDCYINISGHNTYKTEELISGGFPLNIPSSRFYRPYMTKGGALMESLKLKRIKSSMTHAAKHGELYHLWWHPHNFGDDTSVNFDSLKNVLDHFIFLRNTLEFGSATMKECAVGKY